MSLVKVFSEHLLDFYEELIKLYPRNNELKAGKTIVDTLKKFNPKKLIESWQKMIAIPYGEKVMQGDITFFLNHDYEKELNITHKYDRKTNEDWMKEIKDIVRNMEEANLKKSIKYFQNLTKICKLYYK